MKFVETIQIPAPAEVVWRYLADPVLQAEWNDHIVSIDRNRTGPLQRGERFEMLFKLSGKENFAHVEAITVERDRKLVCTHRSMLKSFEQLVKVTFELQPDDHGVTVKQTVDFVRTGIRWYFRILIWLISTFGEPTGASPLENLAKLIQRKQLAVR